MNFYIIVASKDHVLSGVENGIAQAGHGKMAQLKKLAKEDWIIYYSSKDKYENGKAYQKFTAIGQVEDDKPYQETLESGFEPWRRKVNYYSAKELEIRPLLETLDFITNKKRWGLHLMSGFVEINKPDFKIIADKMLINKKI